jgi:4'-phosphopantetheinyl transferase
MSRRAAALSPWCPALPSLALAADEAHVWRIGLDVSAATRARLHQTLDEDERRNADAFHFTEDRHRYVVTRGTLRVLLGRYLGRDPRGLHFRHGPHGKPALVPTGPEESIRFNVAHSADLALVAVAREREVGVDVERIRAELPIEELAHQVFSPHEIATLLSLSGEARIRAFFAGWTRKEAYVKALGMGLARALEAFDVSLAPGEPARLLADRAEPAATARWSLRDLAVGVGYAAALVAAGTDWRLSAWQWQT